MYQIMHHKFLPCPASCSILFRVSVLEVIHNWGPKVFVSLVAEHPHPTLAWVYTLKCESSVTTTFPGVDYAVALPPPPPPPEHPSTQLPPGTASCFPREQVPDPQY